MFRKVWFILFMLMFMALASCSFFPINPAPAPNMPNPASVYCEEHGGKLEFKTDASGGVSGVCVFPDASTCDEWAFFRGECRPGNTPDSPAPTPAAVVDDWQTYHSPTSGYRFAYPADAKIVLNDNPQQGFSIVGPEKDGESWPMISISHPLDLAAYRPTERTDLLQWLTDHNMLGANRQPDAQIAGAAAIHLRQDRSPQSYAFDTYYFARAGQLYQIIIGHTGDKEDWNLYNHFLQSIQFE